MSLILNKNTKLNTFLGFSAFVVLTGCSQKQHSFCLDNPDCAPPSPPQLTAKQVLYSKHMGPAKHTADHQTQIATEHTTEIKDHSNERSSKAIPAQMSTRLQVIEHIRLPAPKQSRRVTLPEFKELAASADKDQHYTIQLGAYKLESSRQHVIKQFAQPEPLIKFKMTNGYLGLAYGQFSSRKAALEATKKLKALGFNDLMVRTTPITKKRSY